MAHFGGQKEGGHAPANVVSKGDYYIMTMGSIDSLLFLLLFYCYYWAPCVL